MDSGNYGGMRWELKIGKEGKPSYSYKKPTHLAEKRDTSGTPFTVCRGRIKQEWPPEQGLTWPRFAVRKRQKKKTSARPPS